MDIVLVDTQHNKKEAIKNAPKITHWDMKTVNILYSWVEKYNLAEYTGQEFVDLFENSFTRQQIYNLKVMINAMEKSKKGQNIKLTDFNFKTLRSKIEDSIPTSSTTEYFSVNNTTEQNLLCKTGELIPMTSEETQTMVEKINDVVWKLDNSYQHPGNPAKDAIMKWAKKMKPNKADHKWSELDIQQFKDHWLKKVLYNNNIAIDANCIDNFDDLCINLHAYVADMKNVEAQYYAYHPYAKDCKLKEHKGEPSKKETGSTLNHKKRGSESQEGKPKRDPKIILPICYSCGRGHNGECFLSKHPDSNKDPQIKFSETAAGNIWLANGIEGLNTFERVEGKVLRPLEQGIQDEIKKKFAMLRSKGTIAQNATDSITQLHTTSYYCCQTKSEEMDMLFDAEVGTKMFNPKNKNKVRVLLDSGSIHANLINENIAEELVKASAKNGKNEHKCKRFWPEHC